jgi:hypothetical protein
VSPSAFAIVDVSGAILALAWGDISTTERTVTKSAARRPLEKRAVPAVGSTWFDAMP